MINLKELRKRKDYIKEELSPSGNLIIWNYTCKCQYDNAWDEYTMICRGLITDLKGNIIARPFPKFFNVNETESTMIKNLPSEIPVITEKLDGSLGILYKEDNQLKIATRGSFISDQALWATKWIQERFTVNDFEDGYTYLFEIIYPDNRIVVDYKDMEELILLAIIHTETGIESYVDADMEIRVYGKPDYNLKYAKVIDGDINQIMEKIKTLDGNEEGFVARYSICSNGLRVKFKGEEYKRIHKLLTQFSTISIWENLKAGNDISSICSDVPDEFYNWIKEEKEKLENKYYKIYSNLITILWYVLKIEGRKERALFLQKNYPDYLSIVFAMLDDKFKEEMIWKRIRPEFSLPGRV